MGKDRQTDDRRLRENLVTILIAGIGISLIAWTQSQWFKPGLPFTHDGQIHLTRMAQYYLSVKEGQIPPRWAGQLNNSFGYPVFNFNYPLPDLMTYPLIAANLSVISVYKLLVLAAMLSSFLAVFGWLSDRINRMAGLVGGLFYVLNPYFIELMYVRGSIGELMAAGLFPWLLYFTARLIHRDKTSWVDSAGLALIGGMFLISHNIMVLILMPLLVVYILWSGRHNLSLIVERFWPPLTIMLLLAAFFWLPALAEKQFTNLDWVSLSQGYADHFIELDQLFSSAWGYGFSYKGPVDGISFSIGLPQLTVLVVGLLIAFRQKNHYLLWLLGLLSVCIFLMLLPAAIIWHNLPMLHYVQFPWRFLLIVQFTIAIIAAIIYSQTRHWWGFWTLVGVILLVQGVRESQAIDRISINDQDLFYATETTSTLDENMPRWFDKNQAYRLKDSVFGDRVVVGENPATTVSVQTWTGSRHEYEVTLAQPDRLIERSAYFPGWEVRVNRQTIGIDYEERDYPGLITYTLNPGHYVIKSQFTQNTWPRWLGNSLTIIGLMSLIIYPLLKKWRKLI